MFNKTKYFIQFISLVLLSIVLFNGCNESDPVIPPTEHFEPEGWLIRDATQKPILVVWQGVIQSSWNSQTVDTTFKAPLNALSDHLTVKFLDAQRNIFNPPSDADHQFGWTISDTSKLAIVQDSPGDWAFHLKGKQTGSTSIELQVLHAGHVDVRTPYIPVLIDVDTTAHGEPIGLRLTYEENGTLIATASDTNSTGAIEVQKDSTTDHILIEYFDALGHYFQPEYPLHHLQSVLSDSSIAEVITQTDEPWVIQIKGKAAGTCTITFSLIVGGSSEFDSFPITITVIP
ncbi:MAG: hypothetical protein IPM56_06630 [Ignavibacteriales bacterium]|nr:MAG: hypothetical protein IPM56_06630 [Ignavibacteriales bacterium]